MKFEDEYGSIEELVKEIGKQKEGYLINIFPENNFIEIQNWSENHEMLGGSIYFKIEEDGKIKRRRQQTKVSEIVKSLAKHIDPKLLLEETLKQVSPDDIDEIYDRVVEKKGKVKSGEGCYSLKIGGKKGKPFELCIIN